MAKKLSLRPMNLEWLAEALQMDDLFSEQPAFESLLSSLPSLGLHSWPSGEVVIAEGDPGEDIFVLYTGSLSVWRGKTQAKKIGVLKPGDFFGEIGFLLKSTRSATVRTETPCKLFRFPAKEFASVLERHKVLAGRVKEVAAGRLQTIFDQQ